MYQAMVKAHAAYIEKRRAPVEQSLLVETR